MKNRKSLVASGWLLGLLVAYGATLGAAMADPLEGREGVAGQSQRRSSGLGNGAGNGVGNGAVALPSAAQASAATSTPSTLSFTTIVQSARSGIVTPGATVAVRDSEWALLWANHTVNINPAPPAPSVDFTQEQVIAVYLGSRPNGCYSVSITDVSDTATARVVTWKETVPAAGALCPAVMSQPIHIIRMPRTDLPVTFKAA